MDMFIEVVVFLLLGVGAGVVTGLLPGLHPNTVFALLVAGLAAFTGVGVTALLVFVVGLSVTNTLLSFVPALVFGAPDEGTELSVLPGHRYLLEGRGQEALGLTVAGGVGVTVLTVVTLPFLLVAIPAVQASVQPVMQVLLAGIVVLMCWTDQSPARAAAVFLLAGLLGVVALARLPAEAVLFPALTGLFGFPQLIDSLRRRGRIPSQQGSLRLPRGLWKGVVGGYVAGFFAAIFPGIGASQASVLSAFAFRSGAKDFLVSLGGINTANALLTFVTYFSLGKTRSGAVWAASQLAPVFTIEHLLIMVAAGVAACAVGAGLALGIGQWAVRSASRLEYRRLTMGVMAGLGALVVVLGGLAGVLIAVAATSVGLLCVRVGVRRVQLMGLLVLPAILYFAGAGATVRWWLGL